MTVDIHHRDEFKKGDQGETSGAKAGGNLDENLDILYVPIKLSCAPVKEREPVLASACCKYGPNAGEVRIIFEFSRECNEKTESDT